MDVHEGDKLGHKAVLAQGFEFGLLRPGRRPAVEHVYFRLLPQRVRSVTLGPGVILQHSSGRRDRDGWPAAGQQLTRVWCQERAAQYSDDIINS